MFPMRTDNCIDDSYRRLGREESNRQTVSRTLKCLNSHRGNKYVLPKHFRLEEYKKKKKIETFI